MNEIIHYEGLFLDQHLNCTYTYIDRYDVQGALSKYLK